LVTRDEVIQAYAFLLGRAPERETVIAEKMQVPTVAALRDDLLSSLEFQNAFWGSLDTAGTDVGRHLDGPPMLVQLDGPPEQRAAMIEHVADVWSRLGEADPHWSVMTSDEYRQHALGDNVAAFYASADPHVVTIKAFLGRAGIPFDPDWSAFELGCGVARVTSALARHFRHVVGCDVSRPHLDIAAKYCRDTGLTNVSFMQLRSLDDLQNLEPFDFFFSLISLQHSPPPIISAILDGSFAALRPEGLALFQVPTYQAGYRFAWDSYLADLPRGMEMHVLPQSEIFALFERHGMRCIEVQEDFFTGSASMLSHTFLARKKPLHGDRETMHSAPSMARRAISRLFGTH
jgi:SAM-dependent methyltransferase